MNTDEQAIAAVLQHYEDALNASSTAAVMSLYAADGDFMPQHFASSVGAEAVSKAYDGVFGAITLKVNLPLPKSANLLQTGHLPVPTPQAPLWHAQLGRVARRPIRNCLSSRRLRASGRFPATASQQPTRPTERRNRHGHSTRAGRQKWQMISA